jgi:SpoVK/Ycf46/Vps4 family AAA+-type ATPase
VSASDHPHSHSKVFEAMTVTVAAKNEQLADSWDRIVVDPAVKDRILNHALMAINLRKAGIGGVGLPLHGLLLLNGLPGVGKTTLARGLASAVAENLGDRFGTVRLVDVNMHLLPSELLGRTQRNIVQLFQEELPALADDGPIVVVLDEVEVLAVSRSEASLDINPADVFRGTAALLSALDWISREAPGVLVVGTTNLAGALDDAVISRADLVMELPLPGAMVIREILADTLRDLGRSFPACAELASAAELDEVAQLLDGTDGRQVRKFVADALASSRETALDPSTLEMNTLMTLAKDRATRQRR